MSKKWKCRIGVGNPQGFRSEVWSISNYKNDVYLSIRSPNTHQKFSLHESGMCNYAMTADRAKALGLTVRDRQSFRRTATPQKGEAKILSVVRSYLPHGFLSPDYPALEDGLDVRWLPNPSIGMARIFEVGFTNEDELGIKYLLASIGLELIELKSLPNGESVYIATCEKSFETPEFIADAIEGTDSRIVYTPRPLIGYKRECRLIQVSLGELFECHEASGYLVPRALAYKEFPSAYRFRRISVIDKGS